MKVDQVSVRAADFAMHEQRAHGRTGSVVHLKRRADIQRSTEAGGCSDDAKSFPRRPQHTHTILGREPCLLGQAAEVYSEDKSAFPFSRVFLQCSVYQSISRMSFDLRACAIGASHSSFLFELGMPPIRGSG